MDCSVESPITIRTTLGGMTTPRVEPQAMAPVLRRSSYLYFFISGRATVVMVAAVAALEPQMAAKAEQARTVAMAMPPRMWPTHWYAAR